MQQGRGGTGDLGRSVCGRGPEGRPCVGAEFLKESSVWRWLHSLPPCVSWEAAQHIIAWTRRHSGYSGL